MVNKKIKVIARIERDARNFFFVRMLYDYTGSKYGPITVFEIEDSRLIDTLITLSNEAIKNFPINKDYREFGSSIIIYDTKSKYCYNGYGANYKMYTKIIVGTVSERYFEEINYLIHMISETIEKNNMGEFEVQYKDTMMTENEFYEFQKQLSIYKA